MLRILKCRITLTQQVVNNKGVAQTTSRIYHSTNIRFELIQVVAFVVGKCGVCYNVHIRCADSMIYVIIRNACFFYYNDCSLWLNIFHYSRMKPVAPASHCLNYLDTIFLNINESNSRWVKYMNEVVQISFDPTEAKNV